MKPNIGFYVQKINDIVKDTEAIGEQMNPNYEVIRQAIDEDKLATLTPESLAETREIFEAGTDKYREMLSTIGGLRPPAKVLGIHKKFERAYENYVAGCEEMIASIKEDQVDVPAFNAAESKQDEATEVISFSIQRMTNLLLGR
ncbi:hypothetical protein P7G51_00320 [Enterococcus asini]|uniref:hypothetical protein n=1 Tax=Enterococcus asini TaxID=57732 RepID=UPI0028926D58|nr:hypothetical protein [Enterococcus asini]MDT2755831.1 hypothetical protein [Enterococcus asini]